MRLRNLLFCPELSFPRSIPREIVMTDPARRGRDVPGHAPAPALPTRTGRLITTTRGREIPEILQRRGKELVADLAARNPEILIQRSLLLNPQTDKVLDLFKSTFGMNPPQPGNRPTPAFYYDTCILQSCFRMWNCASLCRQWTSLLLPDSTEWCYFCLTFLNFIYQQFVEYITPLPDLQSLFKS